MAVSKIIIILILCIFLSAAVFAQPQLSSSIGSLELSGEQCPGTLTLTCDARNFGPIDSINWFVGGERVAEFDYNADSTPFTTTTTRPDLLNATVQLTSATFTGGQFSFINFTLSASVSNFLSLQGQNISCGNLALRSLFGIREFTVNNEATSYHDISHFAKYSGSEGSLTEVMLNWTEIRAFNCTNIISYSINISNKVMSMRRNFTSEVCSSSQCSYEIDFTQNITSDVIVEFYADGNLISSKVIASTTGNNVSVDECSREVSIRCSDSNTNENCTINYQQDGMDFTRTIPTLYDFVLPVGVQDFQVTTTCNNGSTILQQNVNHIFNDTGSSIAALTGVGVALFVLGLTEYFVAMFVFLFFVYKKKQDVEQCWKRLIPILLFMAAVMYFIIIIVWIVVFIASTQDLCGTLKSAEIAIQIVAFVLSIMITLISTVIHAVVLIVWPCKKCNPDEEAEYELQKCYDFTFGDGKQPDFKYEELKSMCPNCNEEVSFVANTLKPKFCDVCGKQMCTNCKNKVFVFRKMGFGCACKKCEAPYWEQQKQFAKSEDSICKMSLLWREKCGEPCRECNDQSNETNFNCYLCGKGICSKNHTRPYKEGKKKPIEGSTRIDDKTTFETQFVNGDQASASKSQGVSTDQSKDKKASASKAEVVPGDQVKDKKASASKTEVVSGDQVKDKKASASKTEVVSGDQVKDIKESASKSPVIPGDQVKDKKTSASKTEVVSGDQVKDEKASASKSQVVPGDQVKDKKASASKSQVVPGDQVKDKKGPASKSLVIPGDQVKDKKGPASKSLVIPGDQVKDKKASASKSQVVPGDQVKDKKASASKSQVVPGYQVKDKKASPSKSLVVPGDQDQVKEQKEDKNENEIFICRMCHTVYSRKQHYEEFKK